MSEPHTIHPTITRAEADHIIRLLERGHQPALNALAMSYKLVTPAADAETVQRRLRNLALGVIESRFVPGS